MAACAGIAAEALRDEDLIVEHTCAHPRSGFGTTSIGRCSRGSVTIRAYAIATQLTNQLLRQDPHLQETDQLFRPLRTVERRCLTMNRDFTLNRPQGHHFTLNPSTTIVRAASRRFDGPARTRRQKRTPRERSRVRLTTSRAVDLTGVRSLAWRENRYGCASEQGLANQRSVTGSAVEVHG